jgi:hypothetical protein
MLFCLHFTEYHASISPTRLKRHSAQDRRFTVHQHHRVTLIGLLLMTLASPCCPPLLSVVSGAKADAQSERLAKVEEAIATGQLELIPLMITGDKDKRINIVAMNRWERDSARAYNKPELREEFIADARHILQAFSASSKHAIEPYPSYRNFFNVYAVWWPDVPQYKPEDRENGMAPRDYDAIRDRLFLPWKHAKTGWVTMLAMLNGNSGGGGAALNMERRVGNAMIVGNEITSFIHEFNHTAPGIPDEYTSSGMWGHGGEISSATSEYRRDKIRWRAWIRPDTPIPTPYSKQYADRIGLFEGGQSRLSYVYRPTAQGCLMGAGSAFDACDQMCAICRQRAVIRCYQWVNPIENALPAQRELGIDGAQTLRFSIDRIKPEPDTQFVQWRLNGRIIAQNTDQIDVTFGTLKEYQLECQLQDRSRFVKQDPPYSSYPQAAVIWRITNQGPAQTSQTLRVSLQGRDPMFRNTNDGCIQAQVSGGCPPYTYHWEDGSSLCNRDMLNAGHYTLTVTDSDLQTAKATVELKREHNIDPELVSTLKNERWEVTINNPSLANVSCQWSNGETGAQLSAVPDGNYACTILHQNGSRLGKAISLKRPAEPLSLTIPTVYPSCGGANNGVVVLAPSGGRAPYCFLWSDGHLSDNAQRSFITPGQYQITVKDANQSRITKTVTIKAEPGFLLSDLMIGSPDGHAVEIKNPKPGYQYLWYEKDHPAQLPRFPHGLYKGSCISTAGTEYYTEAYVVQNKAGISVDPEPRRKNNYGYWINLMVYLDGPEAAASVYEINTKGRDRFDGELKVDSHHEKDVTFTGNVVAGKMILQAQGELKGRIELLFSSHPAKPDAPLHLGNSFTPTRSANYYVAARKTSTGAISTNRLGFALTVGPDMSQAKAVEPDQAKNAKLLLWFDASDMDSDGQEDRDPPRRGAVIDWKDKAAGIKFGSFVHYQPYQQNGKGIASWETIWLQWMSKSVTGFQTIFMVRREHDFSALGTAPWQELRPYMGVGAYGEQLMSTEAARTLEDGALYVNGHKVDPASVAMPQDFYVVTYEFDQPIDISFRQTDGHWEGAVAECIVYNGKLTEAERRSVEQYLSEKWLSALHQQTASSP